ncbi:type II toxin-antitoxin system VapC family toxin [Hymenobacter sp.]|jgi:tRNA(fMet)-specific endonuclease VapC|uniref:type II toxin-antitoxin system VapC family toxin n=1 Tax=Hymenobacter sp. TaxID=1898978 RepID=UPI002ED93727
MTTIALDTNVAVDLLNGKPGIVELLRQFDIIYLPVTVSGELLFGAKNSANRLRNESRYQAFIESCILLDTNALVAETYAEIRLSLKQKGRPIPENDIWIGALCVVHEVPLLSHDRHFEYIEGLELHKVE